HMYSFNVFFYSSRRRHTRFSRDWSSDVCSSDPRIYGGYTSHLPLKLNMSGVIPPIFASSIILFPATIAQWFTTSDSSSTVVNWSSEERSVGEEGNKK